MKINKDEIKKRIIYRASYRGTKEMDVLISSFVKSVINNLNDEELLELEKFVKYFRYWTSLRIFEVIVLIVLLSYFSSNRLLPIHRFCIQKKAHHYVALNLREQPEHLISVVFRFVRY